MQEQQRAEEAARNHVVAKVHQYAARQAAAWAAAQQLAITWLQTSVDAEVADYVEHHVGVVKGILSDTGLLKVGATPMAGTNLISEQAAGTAEPMDIEAKSVPKAQLMQAGHSGPWSAAAGAQIHEQEQVAANATAAAAKAAAISQATAIAHAAAVKASSADASAAQAAATSAAAVAALQATAVDSTAPAAAVASAIDEAARALAEAKAKATATAEAVLQAAMAQEQQKVLKKANKQLFSPLTQGLVDYPSDEDSHTSRTLSDTDGDTAAAQPARGMAAKSNLAPKSKGVGTLSSLLPMYSTELSGTGTFS